MSGENNEIRKYLESIRSKLLDLSLRNKLLNFRPVKAKSLLLTTVQPEDLFTALGSGKELILKSLPSPKKADITQFKLLPDDLLEKLDYLEPADFKKLLFFDKWAEEGFRLNTKPEIPVTVQSAISNQFIQTTLVAEDYETILNKLYLTKENIIQEIGTNALYIVLGFLEWQDDLQSQKKLQAPLLVASVQLFRKPGKQGARYQFSLRIEDEFAVNETLRKKLRDSFSIELPELEETDTVESYFTKVRKIILDAGKFWRIKRQVYLSILDFTKLAMYEDLEPEKWPEDFLIQNENIRTLILGSDKEQISLESKNIDSIENFDQKVPLVLDADSSQSTAILEALTGRNLVIEGPPGTGKSQTITNLIATLLYSGKTVLFASEKLAALKVVKNKLDSLGLGDFCLELHSDQADKQKLRQSLAKRLSIKPDYRYGGQQNIDSKIEHYESLKSTLNSYIDTVNSNVDGLNQKKGQILLSAARYKRYFPKGQAIRPDGFDFDNCQQLLSYSRLNSVKDLASVTKSLLENSNINHLADHPWFGVGLSGINLPNIDETIDSLRAWTETLRECEQTISHGKESFNLSERSVQEWIETVDNLSQLPEMNGNAYEHLIPAVLKVDTSHLDYLLQEFDAFYSEYQALFKELPTFCFSENNAQLLEERIRDSLLDLREDIPIRAIMSCLDNEPQLRKLSTEIEKTLSPLLKELSLPEFDERIDSRNIINFVAALVAQSKDVVNIVDQCDIRLLCRKVDCFDFNEFKCELEALNSQKQTLQSVLNITHTIPVEQLNRDYQLLSNSSFFSWFNSDWRRARSEIKGLLKTGADLSSAVSYIPNWIEFQKKVATFSGNDTYQSYFGGLFKGLDTDLAKIQSIVEWCRTIKRCLDQQTSMDVRRQLLQVSNFTEIELDALCSLEQLGFDKEIRKYLQELDLVLPVFSDNVRSRIKGNVLAVPDLLKRNIEQMEELRKLFEFDQGRSLGTYKASLWKLFRVNNRRELWQKDPWWSELDSDHLGLDINESNDQILKKRDDINELIKLSSVVGKEKYFDIRALLMGRPQSYSLFLEFIPELKVKLINATEKSTQFYTKAKTTAELWDQDSALFGLLQHNENALEQADNLSEWLDFVKEIYKVRRLKLKNLTNMIQRNEINIEDIDNAYRSMAYGFVGEKILDESPELELSNIRHDQIQRDFIDADRELKQIHAQQIRQALLYKAVPSGKAGSKVSELTDRSLIEHEIKKSRRLISNRELISRARNAVIGLKPCFMMSPLSVAQYLKPSNQLFDVVVMDEASQIKPEDAIGVIARAKQLIVVGDPQQLPPTSFFQNVLNEDDEESSILEDSESILDTAWSRFDRCTLNWHYRSRHQSLIAFSNHYFYHDRLTVFPSPYEKNADYGIKFHYLSGIFNEHGTNREEAKAIAQAVINQIKNHRDESFGVVAMNAAQSECIRNEIEILVARDREARYLLDDNSQKELPWFVKNLENVQGDERDVIFISMTYGPATSGGRVAQRFGPITQHKGGRRLNVLFSRARKRMEVFSSMKASDVLSTQGKGTSILHDFLEYCTTGQIPESVNRDTNRAPDSDFEIAVAEALRDEGYECVAQVGAGGYFIDIGVVDPRDKNKFILGIECDGASYHSSASARERDRLRQEILEGLGWRIIRVWSTDWFQNPKPIVNRIVKEIQKICDSEPFIEEFDDCDEDFDQEDEYSSKSDNEYSSVTDESPVFADGKNQLDSLKESLQSLAEEIVVNYPETAPEHRLLRNNMLNYFLAEMPINKDDFLETCPIKLRSETSAAEAAEYLPKIFRIIRYWS